MATRCAARLDDQVRAAQRREKGDERVQHVIACLFPLLARVATCSS